MNKKYSAIFINTAGIDQWPTYNIKKERIKDRGKQIKIQHSKSSGWHLSIPDNLVRKDVVLLTVLLAQLDLYRVLQ